MQPLFVPDLSQHDLFRHHPEVWRNLRTQMRLHSFESSESILHHGDAANNLWLIINGWVKLTRQTPDGKETVVGLCHDGDVFGEAVLFPHANYPYHAQAVGGRVQLASLPATALRPLLRENHDFSNGILSMMNDHMSQTQLKMEHLNTLSSAQRLGCFLLRLCHQQTDGGLRLRIPLEKHVLAAYLGMKPETFSRSQQQLKAIGIHIRGPQVNIENIHHLRQFVCGSCSESGACDVESSSERRHG